jgi:hypothetical protein
MSYIRCNRLEIGHGRGARVTVALRAKCYGRPNGVTADARKTRNVSHVTLVTQFPEGEPRQAGQEP